MCLFNSAEQAYLEQNVIFYPLNSLIGRKYSFQKLTQFSQRKNVLRGPASNIDDFLSQMHVFLQLM
jgi:hypothetical protein